MSAIPNVPEPLHAQRESSPDAALAYLLQNKNATANRLQRVDSKTTNGFSNEAVPQWSVHDSPIENQRPIKVIVIGAGYSGIYLGIRLPERLRNCELVIYEKNKGVGGAWLVEHDNCFEIKLADHLPGTRIVIQERHVTCLRILTSSLSTPSMTGRHCMPPPRRFANIWSQPRVNTALSVSPSLSTRSPIADGMSMGANGTSMSSSQMEA